MLNFRLHLTSCRGLGRDIPFSIDVRAASDVDAVTIGKRMDMMGWELVRIECLDS